MREPEIVINGVQLTQAQAMTVRVALGSFIISLSDGLGDDETGQALANGYRRACAEVSAMIRARPQDEQG